MSRGNPRQAAEVGLAEARRLLGASVKEADFQADVLQVAQLQGWRCYHTHDSRRSAPGFPDLVCVRGTRLVLAELKREGQYPTAPQRAWLEDLAAVKTVDVRLWRPTDWLEIEAVLTRRSA